MNELGAWHPLFSTLAQSAAALIGLLFVAMSIQLDKIMGDGLLRLRARNSALVFIIVFLEDIAVLAPQDVRLAGAQVLVLSLLQLYFPFLILAEARRMKAKLPPLRIAAGILGGCATTTGAAGLMMSQPWGLHMIAAGNVAVMVVLVINAWSLMVSVYELQKIAAPK